MIILTNQTKIIIIKKSTCENCYTLEHIDLKSKGTNYRKHTHTHTTKNEAKSIHGQINMYQRKDTSVKQKNVKLKTKLRDSYGSYLTGEEIKERKLT